MASRVGKRLQRLRQQASRSTNDAALINFSVRIRVVDGDQRVVLVRDLGGMYETSTLVWTGEQADEPAVTWTLSEAQHDELLQVERILTGEAPPRSILVGGMGSGKTVTMAHVAAYMAFFYAQASIGMLAPIRPRLGILRREFAAVLHPAWVVDSRENPQDEPPFLTLCSQVRYQFVATKEGSRVVGSPVQGYSWVAACVDEEQNCSDDAMAHVAMRGRAAVDGHYPVISTCTIADTPEFRSRLAKYDADRRVSVRRMSLLDNPFVEPKYIEDLKDTLTPRQWQQLVLGQAVAPERRTYQFDRKRHVRPRPAQLVARDITRQVTGGYDMLIGHDPGELVDVSVLLKCYDVGGRRHWWVVDELTTERTTSEQHAAALRKRLQDRWRMQFVRPGPTGEPQLDESLPHALIRADPHNSSEGAPDQAVYRYFQGQQFHIKPAAYRTTTNGANAGKPGTIKRESRIEVVNTLLLSAAGETRLYIDCNDRGYPVAPKLATALEMSERDEFGRPEQQRKGQGDQSHWPSALGFALYSYERAKIAGPVMRRAA